MKTPKPPAAPDPQQVARAQTQSNILTGVANSYLGNANQVTPFGTVTNKQTGSYTVGGQEIPQFTQTVQLSPQQQQIQNQSNQYAIGAGNLGNQYLRQYGQQLLRPPQDFSMDRQRVEEAIYSRLRPELDRDRAALENQLANQGIRPESEAYREALALSDREQTDARMQAILYGGQEQSRLANLTQAQQAGSINNLMGLMNRTQVQAPNAQAFQGGNIAGTNTAGIMQQGYENALVPYNAAQANRQAMMGGLAGIAGTGAKAYFGGLGG